MRERKGAWVSKREPGMLGPCIRVRASLTQRTVLAPCLGVINLDCSAAVGYPPFSALGLCSSSHMRDKALESGAATVRGSWWKLPKERGKFWILCFSLTYLCFTDFEIFPIIKIHLSDYSSNSFSGQSPLQKNCFSHTKICGEKMDHLVLTSSPCS